MMSQKNSHHESLFVIQTTETEPRAMAECYYANLTECTGCDGFGAVCLNVTGGLVDAPYFKCTFSLQSLAQDISHFIWLLFKDGSEVSNMYTMAMKIIYI